ncbi:MAG: hypothetical protein HY716_16075 [Planctomycetes bacterium]|nr:hypothetical protein [Planctomycetota bacterium]
MRAFAWVVSAVLAAGGPLFAGADKESAINWLKNPKFGFAKAKLEKRATMVFFTADW